MIQPLQLLYIPGSGRCESAPLSRLFGEIDCIVNVGEAADQSKIEQLDNALT